MSRVGVLARLHNAVGNLVTYIWLRQSFVAISFERCRYFLAHVACRNLPWQGLKEARSETRTKRRKLAASRVNFTKNICHESNCQSISIDEIFFVTIDWPLIGRYQSISIN